MTSQTRPVILVAEDEALVRILLVDVFEEGGFEVLEALDGIEALALLRSRADIAGVMTDVQMPGAVNGFEVARVALAENPRCTVVIASGRQWPKPGDLPSGAKFVQKPFSPESVVRQFAHLRAQSG